MKGTAWKVSVFGVILVRIFPSISSHSVQMQENMDQGNSEYEHFYVVTIMWICDYNRVNNKFMKIKSEMNSMNS